MIMLGIDQHEPRACCRIPDVMNVHNAGKINRLYVTRMSQTRHIIGFDQQQKFILLTMPFNRDLSIWEQRDATL